MSVALRGFDSLGATLDSVSSPAIVIASSAGGNWATAPQAGDYALLFVTVNLTSTITPPSGWSLFAADNTNSNDFLYVFEKTLVSGDIGATVQVTSSIAASMTATVEVYSGSNNAVDAFTSAIKSVNSTTVTIPDITPVADNCMRVYVVSSSPSATATPVGISTPTNFTEDADNTTSGTTNTRRLGHAVGHKTANIVSGAGVAQGALSATSVTSTHEICYSLTIAPATGVTVPAGLASGTGAAQDPAPAVTATPSAAAGSGDAQDPGAGVAVPAGLASGTGDATFDTTAQTVDLELVADNPVFGTGVALDPAGILLVINAEVAAGSGAAFDGFIPPQPLLNVLAELAAAAGSALDAFVDIFIPPLPALFRFDSPTQTLIERPFGGSLGFPTGPAVERVVGLTVLRVGGVWKASSATSFADEAAADRFFLGGHYYVLDEDAANELIAAGFGANLTRIQ